MQKKIVRFEIQDLLPLGLTLVVAGIGIVYGMNMMGDIKEDFCSGTNEHYDTGNCYLCDQTGNTTYISLGKCANESQSAAMGTNNTAALGGDSSVNASTNAIKAVAKIPEKMPLIATVIVAAVIIGILIRYLMVRFA